MPQNFIEEGPRRGLEIFLAGQIRWAIFVRIAVGVALLVVTRRRTLDVRR